MNPWIVSLRLRTLPLAISVIALGAALAYRQGSFDLSIFIMALITTVLLQILSNLANEYGDFDKGTDNDFREGPVRSIQAGHISKKAMFNAVILLAVLSLVSGIGLLFIASASPTMFWSFLALGITAIAGAVYYTFGEHAYGYKGLGDISVFLFFGLLGVVGSYFLFTKSIDPLVWLPAITVGVFSTAVLNVNNLRDILNDAQSGKVTVPVRLGQKRGVQYHWALLFTGWLASVMYTALSYSHPAQWLFLLITPLLIKNAIGAGNHVATRALDPYLKQMVISTLLYVILFASGLLLA